MDKREPAQESIDTAEPETASSYEWSWRCPDHTAFVDPFADQVLQRYLNSVIDWHGYIRFVQLPHLGDKPDTPIDELFVQPRLSDQHIRADAPTDQWAATTAPIERLRTSPRLVVLGDPGSGKSTLINWLAWLFTQTRGGPWTAALGPLIPLPFVLRELRLHKPIGWESLLGAFLAHPVAEPLKSREAVERLLRSGQALLLLDGLDEIRSERLRKALRDAVHEGMRCYPTCRWVLTSRLVGYEEVPFDFSLKLRESAHFKGEGVIGVRNRPARFAAVSYVAPFSDTQIEKFAALWYRSREHAEAAGRVGATDLVAAINANEGTRRLARIPNLLTLMALIHRVFRHLPHGRALLYDKITEAYLESIDQYRGLLELDYPLHEKTRWLSNVAFRMQLRRASGKAGRRTETEILADSADVVGWIAGSMAGVGRDEAKRAGAKFLDYVGRRSGLLLPRAEGQYAFTHLSFQEYFAACYLEEHITTPEWALGEETAPGTAARDLRKYADRPVWRETLILLFEILANRPKWVVRLADTLFGKRFGRWGDPAEDRDAAAAALLAELAVDRHAGLTPDQRQLALQRCWEWELRRQSSPQRELPGLGRSIGETLINTEGDLHSRSWDALEGAWQQLQPTGLSLPGCTARTHLSRLSALTGLKGLDLMRTQVTDLGPLSGLNRLEWLDLSDTLVSDLGPLSGLTGLQELNLGQTRVTDLRPLSDLTGLQWLDLLDTRVSDLRPLSALTALQSLQLGITKVSDLGPLSGLTGLQKLDLGHTRVSDLRPLSGLTGVGTLELGNTQVSDLSPLSGLTGLRQLAVNDSAVTDLRPLSDLTGLQELYLYGTRVRDLGPLSGLTALQTLSLGATQVSDLRPLSALTGLQTLTLANTEVTDLRPLSGLTCLQSLSLVGTPVTDLGPLSGLADLRTLNLASTKVTDLTPVEGLRNLQILGGPQRGGQ